MHQLRDTNHLTCVRRLDYLDRNKIAYKLSDRNRNIRYYTELVVDISGKAEISLRVRTCEVAAGEGKSSGCCEQAPGPTALLHRHSWRCAAQKTAACL